jgi:phosphoribosylamine-glycine ligase
MNIAIISSLSVYHQLAEMFLTESNVENVYHYGAHSSLTSKNKYHPYPIEIPAAGRIGNKLVNIFDDLKNKNINFVIASGLAVASSEFAHAKLKELGIPYFFVDVKLSGLEKNKSLTKKMLNNIGIPTGAGETVNGKYLFDNFKSIPRPFVVKINFLFQYGKQTVIVTDENYEDVYLDLFSTNLGCDPRITNITFETSLIIEQFIKIKREYSYHLIANSKGWKYLGAARDYKKIEDNDQGFNSSSMGSYNIDDVDDVVHEYADKIITFLKEQGYTYRGFMFLGIAVDENDIPIILEINTRSGDPELISILGSVTNNLSNLFLSASRDELIPDVIHNSNKTVTVRLINSIYDWTKPASFLPKLSPCPADILFGLEGTDEFYIKHSLFTSSMSSHELAAKKIYDYLDRQFVGQYRYRRDIGLLK